MAGTRSRANGLHFLDANRVEHMSGVEVCLGTNENLGEIEGFVIDRATQRLRYFVVDPHSANERCLLPADKPAVLDFAQRKLRVEAEPGDLERLTVRSPEHPEDDVIEAIARHHSAA